jgi:hypothetical protein
MHSEISYIGRQLQFWLAFQGVLIKMRFRHLRRSWRYLTHSLTADDAQTMILGCRRQAGWHPLTILTVEDALNLAHEAFGHHPELPRLIADACAHVGRKWMSTSDELHEAIRWAIGIAEEQALHEGIVLLRRDHDASEADFKDGGRL